MEELVQRLADQAGLAPDVARRVAGIILNFVNREGPPEDVQSLLTNMPGAESVLSEPAGSGSGSGGGVMGVYGELTGAGLGMTEVQDVTRVFLNYGREKAGEDTIGRVVGGIPGLSQFV